MEPSIKHADMTLLSTGEVIPNYRAGQPAARCGLEIIPNFQLTSQALDAA